MHRLALGRLCKLPLTPRLHAGKDLVFEKARRAESFGQVPLELADLKIARNADQQRAQIQIRLAAVKAPQALDQHRRNDQHGVGVAIRVADEQARLIRRGRRKKIQRGAQARQWLGQILW